MDNRGYEGDSVDDSPNGNIDADKKRVREDQTSNAGETIVIAGKDKTASKTETEVVGHVDGSQKKEPAGGEKDRILARADESNGKRKRKTSYTFQNEEKHNTDIAHQKNGIRARGDPDPQLKSYVVLNPANLITGTTSSTRYCQKIDLKIITGSISGRYGQYTEIHPPKYYPKPTKVIQGTFVTVRLCRVAISRDF
jgi:hypothetical protein